MLKVLGTMKRETEKAVLFTAETSFISSSCGPRSVDVWFPKSRVARFEANGLFIEQNNEWLLNAKEVELTEKFRGQIRFLVVDAETGKVMM